MSVADDSMLTQSSSSVALLRQSEFCDEATTMKQEITVIATMVLILTLDCTTANEL